MNERFNILKFASRSEFARAVSEVERLSPEGIKLLSRAPMIEPRIIGWTGAPGAGKSSLISAIVRQRRESFPDMRIGIVAVDPSSYRTGGAVLGDRIRMEELALDENVFIRSVASKNVAGGLSPSVLRISRFLTACGFDEVHIETIGAGQNDVSISEIADTTIVVSTPNTGDSIQALKAGMMEIADIHCVNKSDLGAADRTASALQLTLPDKTCGWSPKIISVSARNGEGIYDLSKLIDEHENYIESSDSRKNHFSRRRRFEFEETVRYELNSRIKNSSAYQESLKSVEENSENPALSAEKLLHSFFNNTF